MCEDCFLNEVLFKDRGHWEAFDLELSKKLAAEKLVPLGSNNDGIVEKDDGCYVYQCTSCKEKWKLRDPVDYNGHGWFLNYATKAPNQRKGCFSIPFIVLAASWLISKYS